MAGETFDGSTFVPPSSYVKFREFVAWSNTFARYKLGRSEVNKSLDLQISSSVGYFKKINAFLVCTMCRHETIHDEWTGVKIKAWLGS